MVSLPNLASAATTVPLDVYGKLPAFEQAAISFSGARVAVVGLVNDHRYALIIGSNNKVQRSFELGDLKLAWLKWAGDDILLMAHRNTAPLGIGFVGDKAELTSMTVLSVVDGSHWEIFGKERLVTGGYRGFYGLTNRNGRWYGYFGGITLERSSSPGETPDILNSTKPTLYAVDLSSAKTLAIAKRTEDDQGRRSWVVGPDGAVHATFDINDRLGEWKITDGSRKVIASGQNPRGNVALMGFGRGAGTVLYFQQDEGTGLRRYLEIPPDGGAATEPLPNIAVSRVLFDDLTHELIGYATDEDYSRTRFLDNTRNAAAQAIDKAFPGRQVRILDWSADYRSYIVTTAGAGDPGTWWLVNVNAGTAITLGTSFLVPPTQVGPVRMVKYRAADGLEESGVLTLPPNREAKNLPVIMLPHGGPAARDYPVFDWWAQAFAEQGYAVFQPNFRGSTGYSTAFEIAGHGEWGRKMQTDISDALAELARQGIVDAKRACIMGASYGGYAALAGVTLQQGIYRCAVSVAGISDIGELYTTEIRESSVRTMTFNSLRDLLGNPSSFNNISPIEFARRADAPVLLIHGKDDTTVRYSQSTKMEKALRMAGKAVELVTLDAEDHWLSKSATRLKMLERSSEFIRRFNPPD